MDSETPVTISLTMAWRKYDKLARFMKALSAMQRLFGVSSADYLFAEAFGEAMEDVANQFSPSDVGYTGPRGDTYWGAGPMSNPDAIIIKKEVPS
jgi:hypothetical protein